MAFVKSAGAAVLSGLGGALLGLFLISEDPDGDEATTGLLILGPFVGLMSAFGGAEVGLRSPRGG